MNATITEYQIEKHEILFKAYQLLAFFYANEQISRIASPDDPKEPLKALETRFLYPKTSLLLLEIAILCRTLDDQIRKSADSPERSNYIEKFDSFVLGQALFDKFSLRDCLNMIIHADKIEPWTTEGVEAHKSDGVAYYGGHEKQIQWRHLDGNVFVWGQKHGKRWHHIIDLPEFVEAIASVLAD